MKPILRGLTENQASTDPTSEDRRLRGRTYAIPFQEVWEASLELCDGGIRGWRVLSSDDQRGVIEAVSRTLVRRREDDVRVAIVLDENAQTRVDVWTASPHNEKTLGRSRRLIGHFMRKLDRKLGAAPGQILDPTVPPPWVDA